MEDLDVGIRVDILSSEPNWVLLLSESEDGGFPSSMWDEEEDDFIEIDWVDIIHPHLEEGAICVMETVGAEKLRYLTGYAIAFNHEGKTTSVSIADIYKKAALEFSVPKGSIATATYADLPTLNSKGEPFKASSKSKGMEP